MFREELKKELDKLNDEQLQQIADFIALVELQSRPGKSSIPLWQTATSSARATEFREWVLQLPKDSLSLQDEAFNRNGIYE